MWRITDAERTKEVEIPTELARAIGVFKDMLETSAIPGSDPVSPKVTKN
jgi:hypothetical protein